MENFSNTIPLNDIHNHDYRYATTYSRFLSSLIDYVFITILGLLLGLGIGKIASFMPETQKAYGSWHDVYLETGLYYQKENGELDLYQFSNYFEYEEHVYQFWNDYLGKKCPNPEIDKYDVYWYNVFIYGQDDILNKYSKNELDNRYVSVLRDGKTLFKYKENSGEKLVNEFAILNENVTNERACTYYDPIVNKERQGSASIYSHCVVTLVSKPWFLDRYNYYSILANSIPTLISFIVSATSFKFMIPLFSRYRKTLGKRITKIGLIDEDGKELSKVKLAFRFFIPLAFYIGAYIVSSMVLHNDLFFLLIFGALSLFSMILVFATKKHRSIHDLGVKSYVCDLDKSITKETKSQIQIIG